MAIGLVTFHTSFLASWLSSAYLFEQLVFVGQFSGTFGQRRFAGSAGVEHFLRMGAETDAGKDAAAGVDIGRVERRAVGREMEVKGQRNAASRGRADHHAQS